MKHTRSKYILPVLIFIFLFLTESLRAQDLSGYVLLRDYNFGTSTGSTVKNITDLGVNFKPYGVAGTSVINKEWQRYQPFNTTNHVFTTNDLELTAVANLGGVKDGGISSGQITTKETFYPSNGKTYVFQLRAKIPKKTGAWPAFWMYSPGGSGTTTSEIDIFEFFDTPTQNTYDWTGFDHGSGVGSNYYNIMTNQWVWHPGFDFSADYHTYTLVWKEGDIQKWVDNTMVKGTNFTWNGTAPQVLINLAVGGNTNNAPNASTFPCKFLVDYFRIYEKSASSAPVNRALNKTSLSSSNESSHPSASAFDGSVASRWSSSFSDPQWIYVDLGTSYTVNRVVLRWEAAYGKSYQIQTSNNTVDWTTVYSTTTGNGGVDDLSVTGTGRYIRMYGTVRGSAFGYSLYEFEVYGEASNNPILIQAEDYTAMSGVQTESTTDVGGGQNVSWLAANDWMDYSVTCATAGTYAAQFRVAGWSNTAQFQLKRGTSVLATVTVPNTGAYQSWTTTAPVNIPLLAGTQTIRVQVVAGGFNVNWMSFIASSNAMRTSTQVETVDREVSDYGITLFPNPVSNSISITIDNDYRGNVKMSLLNSTGQHIKTVDQLKRTQKIETEINVSDLVHGLYFITVSTDKYYVEKIIKR